MYEMSKEEIQILNKLLLEIREPVSNILLYAQVGMKAMSARVHESDVHRISNDTHILNSLRKAEADLYKLID